MEILIESQDLLDSLRIHRDEADAIDQAHVPPVDGDKALQRATMQSFADPKDSQQRRDP